MTDFEYSLHFAIRNIYPNNFLEGCQFHYVKVLWGNKKICLIN